MTRLHEEGSAGLKNCQMFEYRSHYPCSAAELFAWHARPGALERLLPPWEDTTVISREGSLEPGGRVELQIHLGPLPMRYVARHVSYNPSTMFRDIQEQGPFSLWSHSHHFSNSVDREGCDLVDRIEYRTPGPQLLGRLAQSFVKARLQRMFNHRGHVLQHDIALHMACSQQPLRILISGASGVLGRELVPLLTTGGHQVYTLVRRRPRNETAGVTEIFWDPAGGILPAESLPEIDAVIHLSGEYIGLGRWTDEKKRTVIASRVDSTRLLCKAICALPRPPRVMLCASAVGYYGNCGDDWVDEERPAGNDFISEVCHRWEASAQQAVDAGIRTVFLRLGVGLTPRGGALQRLVGASSLGYLRRLGPGTQFISWISSDDMVSAMLHLISGTNIDGPVNIVAPEPVTNSELMAGLAGITGRPLLFPVGASLLKLRYGQMAEEIVLSSCRARSTRLMESGYTFRHSRLDDVLRAMLGKYLPAQ